MNHLKHLFFGIIFAISGAIIAGGLIGQWWAYAIMLPTGATLGWKAGEWV